MRKLLVFLCLSLITTAQAQFTHNFPENKCAQCDYGDKAYPPSFNWPSSKTNSSFSPKYMMVTGPPGASFGNPTSTPTSLSLVSTGEYGAPATIFGSGDMYRMKVDKINGVSFRTELYVGNGGGGTETGGYSDAKWFMVGIFIPSDWCDDTRPMGVAWDMKYPDAQGPPSFFLRVKSGYFMTARKFPQNGSEVTENLFPYEKGKWHYFVFHRNFTEAANPSNIEGGSGGYMVLRYWKQGTTPTFTKVWEHYGGNYVNYSPDPSKTEGYWLMGPYNWAWNNDSEGSGPCNTSLTLYYKHIFTANSTASLSDFNNFISGTTGGGGNESPIVNAGSNATITLPTNSYTFSGAAASDPDGTIANYLWEKVSGGAATIVNNAIQNATVNSLVAGPYTFRLTVTDNDGAVSSDEVILTVSPSGGTTTGPRFTASVGCSESTYQSGGCPSVPIPDRAITSPATVDTAIFYAVHGDTTGTITSFNVTNLAAPGGTSPASFQYLPQENMWIPTLGGFAFSGMTVNGTYTWEVTVNDDKSRSKKDTFNIVRNASANTPPSVNAGSDQVLYLNGGGPFPSISTTLNGVSSDGNGIASRQWVITSGQEGYSFGSSNKDTTTLTGLTPGSYVARLTAVDGLGASSFDDVTIIVRSCDAGKDTTIGAPATSAPLKGTASSGTITSIEWVKVSGIGGSITNATSLEATATGLTAGSYVFELRVTYSGGNVVIDQVNIILMGATTINKQVYILDIQPKN